LIVVDTNVVVRYITRDSLDLSERASSFLNQLRQRERAGYVPEGVLVEIVQVLSSEALYALPRAEIRDKLASIIRLDGVRMAAKQACLRALDIYVDLPPLSFVDALCVAHAGRDDPAIVVSFDRDFRRAADITWERP
jgi:predicted nucleic acid-binding protein